MSRRRNYRDSFFYSNEDDEEDFHRPLLYDENDTKHVLRRSLPLIVITFISIIIAIVVVISFVPLNESINSSTVDCSAKHIHLAQRNNVNDRGRVSMTVSFAVNRQCISIVPSISFGNKSSPEDEATIVIKESPLQFNYSSQQTTDDLVFYSDWLYHVEIPALVAGEVEYWYQIHTTGNRTASEKILFRTPPLAGQPTAFAVVGDLGQTEHSARTMEKIQNATHPSSHQHPISHLIIAGDMSYADSDPTRWPSWFELMEPLLQRTPTHVAAGNHEIECNTDTRDIFIPYEHYFHNPNRLADANMNSITDEYRDSLWSKSCSTPSEFMGYYVYGNSFYAYQHGLVHVIVLNSYTYSGVGSEQYIWLEEELRVRFDRTVTPWLLVVFHCPFYTTFDSHVDEAQSRSMKKSMEPLFIQYGVNWVISGHDHAYLRTRSMKYGQVDSTQNAPIYLIVGAGGNREGHPNGYRQDYPEPWVAERTIVDWGYGHWWIPNATHAHFAWIPDGFEMTEDDVRGDDVWFVNPHVTSYE